MSSQSFVQSELNQSEALQVFYDGSCPLCSREIMTYRCYDTERRLELIDITGEGFQAKDYGLDPKAVHQVFHVRTPAGEVIAGVEGFRQIWWRLPKWQWLAKLTKPRPIRAVMRLGYALFAKLRPFLPRRQGCDTGTCQV